MVNQFLPPVITTPSTLIITAITNSYPMILTYEVPQTGSDTYVVNQLVKLTIPRSWGMFQADGLVGQILRIGFGIMTLDINSRSFDLFIEPPGVPDQLATLSPSGSRNLEYNNLTNEVPFQSLNNIGN